MVFCFADFIKGKTFFKEDLYNMTSRLFHTYQYVHIDHHFILDKWLCGWLSLSLDNFPVPLPIGYDPWCRARNEAFSRNAPKVPRRISCATEVNIRCIEVNTYVGTDPWAAKVLGSTGPSRALPGALQGSLYYFRGSVVWRFWVTPRFRQPGKLGAIRFLTYVPVRLRLKYCDRFSCALERYILAPSTSYVSTKPSVKMGLCLKNRWSRWAPLGV